MHPLGSPRPSSRKCLTVLSLLTGLWLGFWTMPRLWERPLPFLLSLQAQAEASQGEDIGAFMIRNAYHFATLYHAARAAQWELAAYEAEELEENLEDTARAAPTYAALLQQFRQDFVTPLRQALATRDTGQFEAAFRHAVQGCNNCHIATQHAFITIPQEPPPLSIFMLPPVSR